MFDQTTETASRAATEKERKMLVQSFTEKLRPLVGSKSWNYIVFWKLSNDNRCIEWMDCCCAGTETIGNGGEEFDDFHASSSSLPCRDVTCLHPINLTCDLLDQLPSSIQLDSPGVYGQTLLSNQASWLNFSDITSSSSSEVETTNTRVLIPLSLGLLELFVMKHVPEDQQLIDFIRAEYNTFLEQQITNNPNSFVSDPNAQTVHHLSHSIDRINLCTPQLNHLQNPLEPEHTMNNGFFLDGTMGTTTTYESTSIFAPSIENRTFHENNLMSNNSLGAVGTWMQEPSGNIENDESLMCEYNRSDESDPNDDEDDAKYRRRTGKGPQSKNLMAERKRRKKLNDRLYALRALVPKISKLDRASILGDAIDYVKELQKQVEDLQIELEEYSDQVEDESQTGTNDIPNGVTHQNGTRRGPKRENSNALNGFHDRSSTNNNANNISRQINTSDEKVQQMEPQVEVFQLEGNEFFVKVFCEHKSGGFVRLMEAFNSLGFEVTNANATRHTCLVSSIFKIETMNDENLEADQVKESLLELTRNPSRTWPNSVQGISETIDDDYNIHHHLLLHTHQMNSNHFQHLHN